MKKKILFIILSVFVFSPLLQAETLYVTDRILLGIHQQPDENSPILDSIASGTAVTVIQRQDSFIKVRLADGSDGWVVGSYLKDKKPAAAELDAVYAKLQQTQESNKKLADELDKKDREIQVRRDEISNAKTTIKNLQKALKEAGDDQSPAPAVDVSKYETQIKGLEEKIAQLEKEKSKLADQTGDTAVIELEQLQNQNKEFQARIDAALANLKGETVPTAEELAAIRPSFPFWYWLLLLAMLIIGVTAGIFWIDYRYRRKHGGFRL